MTKLGKYISNLLGKEEGPIYYSQADGGFRYEKNDKEVYPKKSMHEQLKDLKHEHQNPYVKAAERYAGGIAPLVGEPTHNKAKDIPITIPERHYEKAKKERSFDDYYQEQKNKLSKQGLGRYE